MNEAEKWIQLLLEWVTSMRGSSMLVTVTEDDVIQTNLPPTDRTAVDQCFQLGRDFAIDHPSSWRTARIVQIRLGGLAAQGIQTEKVLVSMLDGKTGNIDAIPYTVIRDTQKKIVNLRDDGGIAQIAGTYLPAFYVGMRTAHQREQQARIELAKEMERLARQMTQELKKRMGG